MNRRHLMASLASLTLASPAIAQATEWQTRLITSSASGELLFGLHIKLAPSWKTYWRVPGVAGIPPQIKLEGSDIESFTVDYPLPLRITDASGEAIGYHDEVVFILRPKLTAKADPIKPGGKVTAFFGVCQNICRPAKFSADLATAVTDDAVMEKYLALVPKVSEFVSAATLKGDGLMLTLQQVVQDIFVTGPEALYFRKPVYGMGSAKLKIDGLTADQPIQGKELKITAVVDGEGLEQTITVT